MLKILAKSSAGVRAISALTILLSLTEVVFEILIPLAMASLIDRGVELGDMAAVWRFGLLILGLAALQMLMGTMAAHMGSRSAVGFAANLRRDMYDNVQRFAFSNIDKFSTASIVTRLTTDVTNMQNSYQMLLRMAIRGPFMLLFSVIVAFRINAEISLVFLLVIPLMGLLLVAIIRSVHPIFRRVFKTYDKLNNVVQENVRAIRVVKSFNREDYEIAKFRGISEEIYRDFARGERLLAFNSPIMQFFMYVCMLLISWIGAKAIVASGNNPELGMSTGDLTALFSYTMQILMSLMMLSMVFAMLTISLASARRIAELLQEESDIVNPIEPEKEVRDGSICFEKVSFAYSAKADKPVLSDIDLEIAAGETVGILGATGSAKSSLVQLIPRLYDVTEGRLTVGGRDVRDYDLEALRGAVAMVLQKNELFSGSIRENLRWGNAEATDEEMREACRLACADEFIQSFPEGYDTHIEQGGANVSGGQKQRLCIARALLKRPKVLILDDSTSAVDTQTDAAIQAAFAEYIPKTTKIIIAQRISSISHADKIVVMEDGKIAAVGKHEELLQGSAIYREIWELQQKNSDTNESEKNNAVKAGEAI